MCCIFEEGSSNHSAVSVTAKPKAELLREVHDEGKAGRGRGSECLWR